VRRSRATSFDFVRELAIVVPAYFLYITVRGLVEGREAEAFARATDVIQLERAIGIFWEADMQRLIVDDAWVVSLMNSMYTWLHWPVILGTAVWLFVCHRGPYRTFRNAFLITGGMGLIIYATLPVAPPRFLDAWGFVDTIADHQATYQAFQPPAFVNQYAAMPSLHLGWNLLAGIAIVRYASLWPAKVLGALMPIGMFVSIVFTANHFILDGVAGGTLALLGLWLAIVLGNLIDRRDDDEPSRSGPGRFAPQMS
jgi:hypothetical protein